MKLTNLYNYDRNKTFSIKSYARLDNSPIISNAGYAEDCSDELLHPGIYDAAKENRAYLGLAELLGLAGLSFEELMWETLQYQIEDNSISDAFSKTLNFRQAKFKIKINYILRRIDSYWLNHVDKYLVLYNRLFAGQSNEKIARNFGVEISSIKCLILDFRKLWRLYKSQLVSNNIARKLKIEHYEFITQFII